MSNQTFLQLPVATSLNGTEWLALVQNGTSKRAQSSQISSGVVTGLVVGVSGISGGANGDILYDNNGILGEKAVTGLGSVVLATSPVLVTPALGTPSSGILTNATGLPLTTGVTGVLGPTNGGTGQASYTTGDILYASALNTLSRLPAGSNTDILSLVGGVPAWVASSTVGVTSFSAGTTGLTPLSPTTGAVVLAGALSPANGGTGQANNAANTITFSGNFGLTLTLSGATSLTLPTTGTVTALGNTTTGTGAIVLATSPTLVTPALGTPSAGVLTNATGLPLTTGVTGQLGVANGGTGKASLTAYAVLLGGTTTTGPLQQVASVGTSGQALVSSGASAIPVFGVPVERSYLSGLTLSAAGASATFGIAVGLAADSTNVSMMTLASAYTKTTASWAVGTAAGSLDTGTIAINTWYHAYEIQRPDTGVVDIATSLSASAPTTGSFIPVAYTLFRYIGSMKTDGSSQWIAFTQNGDEFLWSTPTLDVSASASVPVTAVSYTLNVPTGVIVSAMIVGSFANSGGAISALVSSLATADTAPAVNGIGINNTSTSNFATLSQTVRTNSSSQIRVRIVGNAGSSLYLTTQGWLDRRGRDN